MATRSYLVPVLGAAQVPGSGEPSAGTESWARPAPLGTRGFTGRFISANNRSFREIGVDVCGRGVRPGSGLCRKGHRGWDRVSLARWAR